MLRELKIKDFAIIDELTISFSEGMNIFTGETGAGKSIIIDALSLILGGRGYADYVRTGCDEARIEALFDISGNEALKEVLKELGHEQADDLIIKRILSKTGKSKVMINDSFSTLSTLNGFSSNLINIYGQNEHQELLVKERHLEMLDGYAGLGNMVEVYKKSYAELKEIENKLAELKNASENREREIGFIKFQLSEINGANLKEGEEEDLKKEKELLLNAERILETCDFGFNELYAKEGSVGSTLSEILDKLEKVKELDTSFESYHKEIQNALYSIEDSAFFFRDYPKNIDFSPSFIDETETRLETISMIKKKYGGSVESVFETKAELEEKLKLLSDITENLEILEEKKRELYDKSLKSAENLSAKRHDAGDKLSNSMAEELKSLAMANAEFTVKFIEHGNEKKLGENGFDEAEFYFSANPGETAKPLLKVASGGELSRVMLALKNVTKGDENPSTLIFDEVDTGIGGKTAHIVGAKLKRLSDVNQVICITHLSQIASYADSYYHVSKEKKENRMVTRVKALGIDERIKEVARLLSGDKVTEHSLKHASDMIEKNKRGMAY